MSWNICKKLKSATIVNNQNNLKMLFVRRKKCKFEHGMRTEIRSYFGYISSSFIYHCCLNKRKSLIPIFECINQRKSFMCAKVWELYLYWSIKLRTSEKAEILLWAHDNWGIEMGSAKTNFYKSKKRVSTLT